MISFSFHNPARQTNVHLDFIEVEMKEREGGEREEEWRAEFMALSSLSSQPSLLVPVRRLARWLLNGHQPSPLILGRLH